MVSVKWYWAEIRLPERITFYTEKELESRGILGKLEEMRNRYKEYQRQVVLPHKFIKALEGRGVEVLRPRFLALEGVWHWFTGYSRMDAFRLSGEMARKIREVGFLTISFTDRLYIVSCTKEKIWDTQRAPKYVPAREAYTGRHFREWLNREESKTYPWLIFSSKYGLIEPDHPIRNYDIEFGEKGSISEETLVNQALHHDFGFKVKDFSEVYFVGLSGYYTKLKRIFEKIGIDLRRLEL